VVLVPLQQLGSGTRLGVLVVDSSPKPTESDYGVDNPK
jgi:hypothetical protein